MTTLLKEKIAGEAEGMAPLTAADIDCVTGAAGLPLTVGLSVETTKKLELARQLEKSYVATHPHEYYGFRI